MWRDRRFQFNKLFQNGGVDLKVTSLPDDDPINLTVGVRKRQLLHYKDDESYRSKIDETWEKIELVYRMTELFRMNLAKHNAPGKDSAILRAPGYGRVNGWCGAIDYELIEENGFYTTMNRRDIAVALRAALEKA